MCELSAEGGGRLLDEILALQREISRLVSKQLILVAAYDEQRGGARDAIADLALTLSISERAAERKLDLATALVTRIATHLAEEETRRHRPAHAGAGRHTNW